MIELNQLEQLIYIAENKTISKAAKELLISQPALSRSMQRLESDLGVELFSQIYYTSNNYSAAFFHSH